MSDRVFASLTPANALARLAISDLYDRLTSGRQNNQADGARAVLNRLTVKPKRTFNREILRLRFEEEKRVSRSAYANDGEMTDSPTEPDTDTEQSHQELGMIWEAHYLLGLRSPPSTPETGWAAGKGPLDNIPIDLLLCTRAFAKLHDIDLRNPHARFNFASDTGGFYVAGCSRSPSAQLTVNEFAAKDDFKVERHRYVTRALGSPRSSAIDMPTPRPNKRTMGKWTLGDALGAGGQGRVFFASDTLGDVAAIKIVERTSRNCHRVDNEIKTLRRVTNLADKSDEGERILRMADVVYSSSKNFSSQAVFDNVAIVLQPMTPQTLADLVGIRSKGGSKGMSIEAASVFREALLGVKAMHDEDWLHSDLKPPNIGLVGTPLRSVLLDVGSSKHVPAGRSLQPEPGTVGTIGYLAPELELENYDHSIDVWAMGIILYELTYGHHPWKFAINPWRDGKDNEKLRPSFRKSYQNAIDKMARDYSSACASPASGYIHLASLFVEMVRYQLAQNNHARRPDIDEVLQHPAWGPLLPESSQVKRRRFEDGPEDGEV